MMLKSLVNRFSQLKTWQKIVVGFVLFSVAVSPFTGNSSSNSNGDSSNPSGTPAPSATASIPEPSAAPLLFTAPDWMPAEVAQQYSDALQTLPELTNMDLKTFISIEFSDFEDGTYGVFVDLAASENFSLDSACRVAFREAQDLFTNVMNTVDFDFAGYDLYALRVFSKIQGTDDFGNPKLYLLKQTGMERGDFMQVSWASQDIQDGINWDGLGSGPKCETYE